MNLRKEYATCFNYISDSRNYIFVSILIFLIFALFGFFFNEAVTSFFVSAYGINLNEVIISYLASIIEQIQNMNALEIVLYIFFNNLKASFYGLFFGIFFGLFSLIMTISNGYLIGFVSSLATMSNGVLSLWRLLPHGVFELPAIFISIGLGLKLGAFVFYKNRLKTLKHFFWNSVRVFALVVFPLLLIAAFIEGLLIFSSL